MGALDPACGCQPTSTDSRCGGSLPDNPECALNYHFGMLLGVDDFRAEQGFHLGGLRRHQRTLHGAGVVYGYGVSFDASQLQLRVEAGYAIDALGRDLQLDAAQCLGLAAWWEKHQDDDAFATLVNKDAVSFDADIVLCYGTCLSRPVPAIADTCASGTTDIAYSRICEVPQLTLVPYTATSPRPTVTATPPPYHLLRLLLGLDQPQRDSHGQVVATDQWLLDHQAQLATLAPAAAATASSALWQAALARDAAAITDPATAITDDSTACITLASLGGVQINQGPSSWTASVANIDIDSRPTLLPSDALQQLLLAPAPASGPELAPANAKLSGSTLTLVFNTSLAAASVTAQAFSVSQFLPVGGWSLLTINTVNYDDNLTVTLGLNNAPAGGKVRIGVHGSGATPLLGADLTPAGAIAADSDGRDLYITISGE